MRSIILLLLIAFIVIPCLSQTPNKEVKKNLPTQVPTKNEMSVQIREVINELNKQVIDLEKQLANAKKNKEEESVIKDLEDQIVMLKKQVEMIGGVNKSMSGISEKTFKAAAEEEKKGVVPQKDVARINSLSKKILSEAELSSFLKSTFIDVEKILPQNEKAEAAKAYNAIKLQYKTPTAFGSAASGYWAYGHQEKAIWIIGKACVEQPYYTDNLSNYAAFLSMMGAEQAAIPILMYLNNKFPNNSTILNNLGQAWFGLGDIDVAKNYFEKTIELYPTHSMANSTLSNIYLVQADTPRAIATLKISISESFSIEKENSLTAIGGTLTFDDLPEFNYPIEQDPFGFKRFFSIIPEAQGDVAEHVDVDARWRGYKSALNEELKLANDELEVAKKNMDRYKKELVSNAEFRQKELTTHNSPAHILANRMLTMLQLDGSEGTNNSSLNFFRRSPFTTSLLLSSEIYTNPYRRRKKPISYEKVFNKLSSIIKFEYYLPLERLEEDRREALRDIAKRYEPCYNKGGSPDCPGDDKQKCAEINIVNNTFLTKAKAKKDAGKAKMVEAFVAHAYELDIYLAVNYYGAEDKFHHFAYDIASGNPIPEYPWTQHMLYKEFLSSYNKLLKNPPSISNACENAEEKPEIRASIPPKQTPKCSFEKELEFVNGAAVIMQCGKMIVNESKIKNSKNGKTKGSAITSNNSSPTYDPSGLPPSFRSGPNNFYENRNDFANLTIEQQPLFPGEEDNTALYIEYDQYGNLTDFSVKLNEEGTALADPGTKKTGLNSRWTWISTVSGREQKLKALFKK